MTKRFKVLVSLLLAVLLLTVGATATAMAGEEAPPNPAPEAEVFVTTANTTGIFARVAEILGIPEEELASAFRQAQQEMRQEAFTRFLEKAVEKGRFTEEEAAEIEEWWAQKPVALGPGLFPRAFHAPAAHGRHLWGGARGWGKPRPPESAD